MKAFMVRQFITAFLALKIQHHRLEVVRCLNARVHQGTLSAKAANAQNAKQDTTVQEVTIPFYVDRIELADPGASLSETAWQMHSS